MDNEVTQGIGRVLSSDNIGLTVSMLFNIAFAFYFWARYKDDKAREERQERLQEADIKAQNKLIQVIEKLANENEKAMMQKLDSIIAKQE